MIRRESSVADNCRKALEINCRWKGKTVSSRQIEKLNGRKNITVSNSCDNKADFVIDFGEKRPQSFVIAEICNNECTIHPVSEIKGKVSLSSSKGGKVARARKLNKDEEISYRFQKDISLSFKFVEKSNRIGSGFWSFLDISKVNYLLLTSFLVANFIYGVIAFEPALEAKQISNDLQESKKHVKLHIRKKQPKIEKPKPKPKPKIKKRLAIKTKTNLLPPPPKPSTTLPPLEKPVGPVIKVERTLGLRNNEPRFLGETFTPAKSEKNTPEILVVKKVPKIDKRALARAYLKLVREELAKRKDYPFAAQRMGIMGIVKIGFTIFPDGSFGEIKIKRSAGHDILDNAAVATIKNLSGKLERPGALGERPLKTTVVLKYTLS